MNTTESEYLLRLEEEMMREKKIILILYEPEALHPTPDIQYTPDFKVIRSDGSVEYHEVKGPQKWKQDVIRFKAARWRYNNCKFIMMQKKWNRKLNCFEWKEVIKQKEPVP